MQFVSIYRVLSKLRRDLNFDFTEADAIEWTGEALASIGAIAIQEEAVAYIEVKQHKALLPSGLTHVIQVARDYSYTPDDPTCPVDVVEEAPAEELEEFVVIDCNGQPVGDYELAYYRPYYSMKQNYEVWTNSRYYQQNFAPVRLADHTFFQSVVCDTRDYIPYESARDEYTVNWPYLNFSFKDGLVAVAYRRQRLDENGYPYIPDDPSYMEAITRYIRYKKALIKLDSGESGAMQYLQVAQSDWHWYCQQAKNKSKMPSSLDQWQDHLEQHNYLLPRQHQFYTFFGKLAEPEVKGWTENKYLGYIAYPEPISPVT